MNEVAELSLSGGRKWAERSQVSAGSQMSLADYVITIRVVHHATIPVAAMLEPIEPSPRSLDKSEGPDVGQIRLPTCRREALRPARDRQRHRHHPLFVVANLRHKTPSCRSGCTRPSAGRLPIEDVSTIGATNVFNDVLKTFATWLFTWSTSAQFMSPAAPEGTSSTGISGTRFREAHEKPRASYRWCPDTAHGGREVASDLVWLSACFVRGRTPFEGLKT
jgi:hypothetical protein